MEEYANKFLELLRYVWYIRDEKVKVQQFWVDYLSLTKIELNFMNPELLKKQ